MSQMRQVEPVLGQESARKSMALEVLISLEKLVYKALQSSV